MSLTFIVKNDVRFEIEDWFTVRLPTHIEDRIKAWHDYNTIDDYKDTDDQRRELAEMLARYQEHGEVQWHGVVMNGQSDDDNGWYNVEDELPFDIIHPRVWSMIQTIGNNDPLTQLFTAANMRPWPIEFSDGDGI